jgi:hypothetical protein
MNGTFPLSYDIQGEILAEKAASKRRDLAGLAAFHYARYHVSGSDETRHKGRIRVAEDLLRRAALRDPALGKHRDDIAQPKGLVEVMGDLKGGDSFPLVQLA